MPLANNSTGAGTGDGYNYSNPTMVAGILSPADGDVYVYGYDDGRKQVIIRKVSKSAQVPHKGMTAHPVYTNNLLSTYQKNAVIPKTTGATHNPQAVVPTVNDYLSTYSKNAVVPTVTDFLSAYVKNAVQPMVGTQQPVLSWGNPERFKQVLQNMSGDLRRGALHGVIGTQQASVTWATPAEFKQQLANISGNPLTGALHGVKSGMLATYGWSEDQKKRFKQTLDNMSVRPPSGAGVVGVGGKGGFTFANGKFKTDRTKQIEDARLTMKPLGGLYGRAGIGGAIQNGRFETTNTTQFRELRKMSSLKPLGAHGKAGTAGSIWGKTGKFATIYTQTKTIMTSLGGAAVSGAMSAATSLISGLADTMKNMLFGGTSWPMSKYYFYVIVGATELGFQSVEGLEAEIGVIEYRDGNSPILAKERIPGMITYSKVTLKKGMFANDTNGANWFKELATDRQYTKRRTILIALLDHNHIPQFIWRYEGCFITKFTPANLDAESDSEIAVEEMEFVGRTFTTETLLGMAAGAAGADISGAMNISF